MDHISSKITRLASIYFYVIIIIIIIFVDLLNATNIRYVGNNIFYLYLVE